MENNTRPTLQDVIGLWKDFLEKVDSDQGHEWVGEFKKFLRKEATWVVVRDWYEQDSVIYFSVVSDGTTGPQWIERLKRKGVYCGSYGEDVLRSDKFTPTNGVTYQVAVLKGMFFRDEDRVTKKIRVEAGKRKFQKPNAEVACLIREKFSDEEIEAMGLWWIIVMHEPIVDSDGDPYLLSMNRSGNGRRLDAYDDRPDNGWRRGDGFAFVVSQICS